MEIYISVSTFLYLQVCEDNKWVGEVVWQQMFKLNGLTKVNPVK